mmetsp:Transcript_42350/g.78925  ORF Transcript_42350/g.78925 Transcript_42350/m.78925 type:complete len:414 (-) Transcript_42350:208-1449(-)
MALREVMVAFAIAVSAAYRENFAREQYELMTETAEQAERAELRADLYAELEAISGGDEPLFGDMKDGRFKEAATLLEADPSSVLSRLRHGFNKGVNLVLVGAGGVGKTESVLLAMDGKTKAGFDLRSWYLEKAGISKDAYLKGYDTNGVSAVKTDQLEKLRASAGDLKEEIAGKTADVLFFDEVDLGNGLLNEDELDAMTMLLKMGNEIAPNKAKVVVLHPLVSTQKAVHAVLQAQGFPGPGMPTWIDFSQPYSQAEEAKMIEGILMDCEPHPSQQAFQEATVDLEAYFMGLPNTYLPFLINKGGILDHLKGKPLSEAVDMMKEKAKASIGGRLIKINIGLQTSAATREAIKALLGNSDAQVNREAAAGAVVAMAVEDTGSSYIIPPVMQDAFNEYCASADDKGKKIVAPICG